MAAVRRADYARHELPDAGAAPFDAGVHRDERLLWTTSLATGITAECHGRSRWSQRLGRYWRFAVALTVTLPKVAVQIQVQSQVRAVTGTAPIPGCGCPHSPRWLSKFRSRKFRSGRVLSTARPECGCPKSGQKVVFAMCEDRAGNLWFGTDAERPECGCPKSGEGPKLGPESRRAFAGCSAGGGGLRVHRGPRPGLGHAVNSMDS